MVILTKPKILFKENKDFCLNEGAARLTLTSQINPYLSGRTKNSIKQQEHITEYFIFLVFTFTFSQLSHALPINILIKEINCCRFPVGVSFMLVPLIRRLMGMEEKCKGGGVQDSTWMRLTKRSENPQSPYWLCFE